MDNPASSSENIEDLLRELHDALSQLNELPVRQGHPLARLLGSPTPSPGQLRQTLLSAIERMKPADYVRADAPRWRRYRYLKLRYVEGARLSQVIADLGISERQARREHRAALEDLAAILTSQPALPEFSPVPASTEEVDATSLDAEIVALEAEPQLVPLDLNQVVDDSLRLISRLAAARGVAIEFGPSPEPIVVLGERTLLRQALLSLLSYSCGLSTSSLRILTREANNRSGYAVDITVSAAASLDENAAAVTASRRLIEGQEGVLRLEPLASGFSAELSLLAVGATTVLIVDDNPHMIRLFRRFLRGEGFRLVQARNGIRALQIATALRPEVILLDLMMPVQDGWDLLQHFKLDPTTEFIPIIACSVLPERDLALSLGAKGFLAKPVTPDSLFDALAPYR